jgi:hypothetical protein
LDAVSRSAERDQWTLEETAAAMRYLEQGHARGKVVIDIP